MRMMVIMKLPSVRGDFLFKLGRLEEARPEF
jgi:predicted RNA polymerase sigma factor